MTHQCQCGERAFKRTGAGWVCRRCYKMETYGFIRHGKIVEGVHEAKVTIGNRKSGENYQQLDLAPIAGVGESLVELERKLSRL